MRAIVQGFVLGTVGLVWLLVPVGSVLALDNEVSCGIQGLMPCKDGTCASRNCTCGIKVLTPGEECYKQVGGKRYWFYCDGCSGKMIQVITGQPSRVQPPAGGTRQR